MTEADFTQERDFSRFQLKSYKWRDIDISSDAAIHFLEMAYQTSYSIEGLTEILRKNISDRENGDVGIGSRVEDQIIRSIDLLSSALHNNICGYADSIEKKIKALELSKQ